MADNYSKWFVTKALATAEATATATTNPITYTKMIASDDVFAEADLPTLTDNVLKTIKVKQTALISSVIPNGNTLRIEGVFQNTGLTAGYKMNTFLLVASINGTEFLAAAQVANTPFEMTDDNNTEQTIYTNAAQIVTSNTAVVNATIDPSALVTGAGLAKAQQTQAAVDKGQDDKIKALNDADKLNVKTTGDQSIDGNKTFVQKVIGSITGTAGAAIKLVTPRAFRVNLEAIAPANWDGTTDLQNIGVSGVLPVSKGGNGNTTASANNLLNKSLGANTDLDAITDAGVYNNADVDTIKNFPTGTNGQYFTLEVFKNSINTGFQRYHDMNKNTDYIRTRSGSPAKWSTWQQIFSLAYLLPTRNGGTGNANGWAAGVATTKAGAPVDLNTLTNPTRLSFTVGNPVLNFPANVTAGVLEIIQGDSTFNGRQIFYSSDIDLNIYTRTWTTQNNTLVWSDWLTIFASNMPLTLQNGGTGNAVGLAQSTPASIVIIDDFAKINITKNKYNTSGQWVSFSYGRGANGAPASEETGFGKMLFTPPDNSGNTKVHLVIYGDDEWHTHIEAQITDSLSTNQMTFLTQIDPGSWYSANGRRYDGTAGAIDDFANFSIDASLIGNLASAKEFSFVTTTTVANAPHGFADALAGKMIFSNVRPTQISIYFELYTSRGNFAMFMANSSYTLAGNNYNFKTAASSNGWSSMAMFRESILNKPWASPQSYGAQFTTAVGSQVKMNVRNGCLNVHVLALKTSANLTAKTVYTMFTLPAGYRPAEMIKGFYANSVGIVGDVQITTDGQVKLYCYAAIASGASLDFSMYSVPIETHVD